MAGMTPPQMPTPPDEAKITLPRRLLDKGEPEVVFILFASTEKGSNLMLVKELFPQTRRTAWTRENPGRNRKPSPARTYLYAIWISFWLIASYPCSVGGRIHSLLKPQTNHKQVGTAHTEPQNKQEPIYEREFNPWVSIVAQQ